MVGPRNGRVRAVGLLNADREYAIRKVSTESARLRRGDMELSFSDRRYAAARFGRRFASKRRVPTRKAAFAASRNFTKKQRRAERKTTGKESARCKVRGCEYRLAGGLFREPVGQTVFATEARRSVKSPCEPRTLRTLELGRGVRTTCPKSVAENPRGFARIGR